MNNNRNRSESDYVCSLAAKRRIDKLMQTATHPQYMCSNCGRVADEAQRVCKAEPLQH